VNEVNASELNHFLVRRRAWQGLVLLTAAGLFLGVSVATGAPSRYCAESGDYCTFVKPLKKTYVLAVETFVDFRKVRICVRKEGGRSSRCAGFSMTPVAVSGVGMFGVYADTPSVEFPSRTAGRYLVTFFAQGVRLGPALSVRLFKEA
jgi:hypothetical protein